MWPPPLLASRPPGLQILIAVVVPAVAGLVCGILLGVSGVLYTIVSLVAILGGVLSGYEHTDALEGAGRGVAGGMLFGTFILFGHAVSGLHAKTSLPSPHVVLPILTTVVGALLATIGATLRGRRERRHDASTAEPETTP